MCQISELKVQAELAFAAYANLSTGKPSQSELERAGMSATQAESFASRYRVVAQFTAPIGASATVFADAQGRRYLAIRGTEDLGDYIVDGILAAGFPSYINPQFIALLPQVQSWVDNGILKPGFSIAGHSLGGSLACAIASLFPGAQAFTYNSPGLGGSVGNVWDALRAVLGLDDTAMVPNITNIRGTAGISVIAGLGAQLSPPVMVETELSLNPVANHGIVGLADALAVYSLFAGCTPSLTMADIAGIIQAASNQRDASLEASVQKLAGILLPSAPQIASGDRNAFFSD